MEEKTLLKVYLNCYDRDEDKWYSITEYIFVKNYNKDSNEQFSKIESHFRIKVDQCQELNGIDVVETLDLG